MLLATWLNNVEPVVRQGIQASSPTTTKEELEKLLLELKTLIYIIMRTSFRKNWLDSNMVSGMSGVSLCVDLVSYDAEILEPHKFKIQQSTESDFFADLSLASR